MNDGSGTAPSETSRVFRHTALPDDGVPLFTVGQAASLLGVRVAFLRRLDSEGCVVPGRSHGGQRRYSRTDINHAGAIVALMGEGMTLAGAQRIIELENEVAELQRRLAHGHGGAGPTLPSK